MTNEHEETPKENEIERKDIYGPFFMLIVRQLRDTQFGSKLVKLLNEEIAHFDIKYFEENGIMPDEKKDEVADKVVIPATESVIAKLISDDTDEYKKLRETWVKDFRELANKYEKGKE